MISSMFQRRDPTVEIQTSQMEKKDNECAIDELKDIKQTQINVDEGILRELLKQGLLSDDVNESLLIADDPEIRKVARRIKIEQRQEELKKPVVDEDEVVAPLLVDDEMKRSMVKILELLEDSRRSVSNVQIASMKHALERQKVERKSREEIEELIKQECRETKNRFDEINSKWKEISCLESLMEIHEETLELTDECQNLLKSKENIIVSLTMRLKHADRQFNEELSKRNDYLKNLEERINDQLVIMDDCYRRELQNLQNVVNMEKREFLDERKKLWEKNVGMKEKLELENTVKRYNFLQVYEEQLDTMTIEHSETMCDQKILMETKLNDLAVEESRYMSAILISSEMLNYNVQVLQKRQNENRIIKAQQKRVVNNLQDVVRRLTQDQKNEVQRLINKKTNLQETIKALHNNVNTLNGRVKNLAIVNNRKYFQLWDYNQQIAEGLVEKLMKADKKFYTSLLCVPWHAPQLSYSRKLLPSCIEARQLVKEISRKSNKQVWPDVQVRVMHKLLTLIVQSIENQTEFLTDDTLKKLLKDVEPTSKTIFVINGLFEALGLSGRDDMIYISRFFLPYVYCIQCQSAGASHSADYESLSASQNKSKPNSEIVYSTLYSRFVETNVIVKDEFCSRGATINLVLGDDHVSPVDITSVHKDEEAMQHHEISNLERFEDYPLPILMTRTPSKLCESSSPASLESASGVKNQLRSLSCSKFGHHLGISAIHISKALNDFVSHLNEERKSNELKSLKQLLNERTLVESRLIKKEDVEQFWNSFTSVFLPKKKIMWKSVLSQMKIYYKTLLRRHNLDEEIKALRQKNIDLRKLLTNYMQNNEEKELGSIWIRDSAPFLVRDDSIDSLTPSVLDFESKPPGEIVG